MIHDDDPYWRKDLAEEKYRIQYLIMWELWNLIESLIESQNKNNYKRNDYVNYLKRIKRMLKHPDLIERGNFYKPSSIAAREVWNSQVCEKIAGTMHKESRKAFDDKVTRERNHIRETGKYGGLGYSNPMAMELCDEISRQVLATIIENELDVQASLMEIEKSRKIHAGRQLIGNTGQMAICRCVDRCVPSWTGKCESIVTNKNDKKENDMCDSLSNFMKSLGIETDENGNIVNETTGSVEVKPRNSDDTNNIRDRSSAGDQEDEDSVRLVFGTIRPMTR